MICHPPGTSRILLPPSAGLLECGSGFLNTSSAAWHSARLTRARAANPTAAAITIPSLSFIASIVIHTSRVSLDSCQTLESSILDQRSVKLLIFEPPSPSNSRHPGRIPSFQPAQVPLKPASTILARTPKPPPQTIHAHPSSETCLTCLTRAETSVLSSPMLFDSHSW